MFFIAEGFRFLLANGVLFNYIASVFDVQSLALVNKEVLSWCKDYPLRKFHSNLETLIKPFGFATLDDFDDFLLHTRLCLSGSTLLLAMYGNSDNIWLQGGEVPGRGRDLDLYQDINDVIPVIDNKRGGVIDSKPELALRLLSLMGYNEIPNDFYYGDLFSKYVNLVITMENGNYQVQIIMCKISVMEVVRSFDFEFLSSYYQSREEFHFCFVDRVAKRQSFYSRLRLDALEAWWRRMFVYCDATSDDISRWNGSARRAWQRVDKYQKRGFRIEGCLPPKILSIDFPPSMW